MSESKKKFSKENPKGVIYTNTAIGFDALNPELLKTQKKELLFILGIQDSDQTKETQNIELENV